MRAVAIEQDVRAREADHKKQAVAAAEARVRAAIEARRRGS